MQYTVTAKECVMLRFVLPVALLAASAASAAERSFPVTGFDRVAATGSEDIAITTGKAPSVTATGPQDQLDHLDIRVEAGTLRIGHKGNSWGWNREGVKIRVTMAALKGVKLAGSGDVTADSGSGPEFTAELSGSGDLNITHIDSASAVFSTAGSGDIAAAGKCTSARVAISGSGDMNLGHLACADIDIRIAGSGDVSANATRTANVRISGSGDVKVTGGARCTSHTSGSGSVSCG
jgi:hypothetical protein